MRNSSQSLIYAAGSCRPIIPRTWKRPPRRLLLRTAAAENRLRAGRRLRELAANLSLHRGFAEVVASLEAGHGGTLGGVWGSSRALVAAALARSCPGPLVVVAPHQGEIEAIARDLALFSDLPVAEFPAWEAEPGERVVHDEIYGARLRVLKELRGASGRGARSGNR